MPSDSAESCKCLEFDVNRAHQWIPFPPEDDFFQDLNHGDFPDWLKIQESDEAIHAALCRAKPLDYQNPYKRKTFVDEPEPEEDEVPVPIEKLPLELLLPLMNTYRFPASHKGLESIPFWIKIFSRFWSSYGFYFVKVGQTEFKIFQTKYLDPNDVWMLPYWCLRQQYRGEWYRYMVLVVRDRHTWQGSPWGTRILDGYYFLKTIASVSVANNKNLTGIRHVACPMIPHAFQWMSHLIPDGYEDFMIEYNHDSAILSNDGITICRLKIGSEGEFIKKSHGIYRKDFPFILPRIGAPFVFDFLDRCLFIEKKYTEAQLQDLVRRTGTKIWNVVQFSGSPTF